MIGPTMCPVLSVVVVGGSPKLVCVGAGVLSFSSENPLKVCIGCVGVVVSPLLHSLVHLHSLTTFAFTYSAAASSA